MTRNPDTSEIGATPIIARLRDLTERLTLARAFDASGKWLRHVASHAWLTSGPPRIVRPARLADGRWQLGDIVVERSALVEARRPGSPPGAMSFDLIHQDWRVAPFRLFSPVVYFVAFKSSEIFECLELAVEALL